MTSSDWPIFDLRDTPEIGNRIRNFIEDQMAELKVYDDKRPGDHTYIFHEHAERVAQNMKKTCLHMKLGNLVAENMYWAILPHDIGKKNMPVDLWDKEEKPTNQLKKFRRTHTLLGAQITQEYLHDIDHPMKDLIIDIQIKHHGQMDGQGPNNTPAEAMSKPVRLAAIVEAYDGWRIWRPHYGERDISIKGVLNRMREEKGAEIFDMELFEAFAEMKMIEYNNGLKE